MHMSYCSNCGGRLNDKGICPNCGGLIEANIKPVQKEDSDVLGCIKAFFSDSPFRGVEKAARTRSATVWVTFGSLFVVAASSMSVAAFGSLSSGFFREVCGDRIASAIENSSGTPILTFTALAAHAALMAMLFVLLLGVVTKVMFLHAEETPSVNQALNIAAISLLPLSVLMLLAIPAALISAPFAVMLIIIGFGCTAIAHYFGVQKASTFKRSPFLTLIVSVVAGAAVLALCSHGLALLFFR